MRFAARIDNTQTAIVEALRAAGVAVYHLKQPTDLLTWTAANGYALLECKSRYGTLTKAQKAFRASWPGPWYIVKTPEEALEAVGVKTAHKGHQD